MLKLSKCINLWFILLSFLQLSINCYELFLNVTKSENVSDYGFLMGKKQGKNESYFIILDIDDFIYGNGICEKLDYNSIHSIPLFCELDQFYQNVIEMKISNKTSFN